jgi:2,3-bisphosphoglycerate-dependent phosphoglycerate mutase
MSNILIARHGNTFDPGDKVVRVGLNTDLHLSSSGKLQAQQLGLALKDNPAPISAVYTSCLFRTIETAKIALRTANIDLPILQNSIFNELDYGPDEGKTETEVIARIGEEALQDWENLAIVPPGWLVDPDKVIRNWFNFAHEIELSFPQQTVLVVTSNGIARFAPYITGDFFNFTQKYKIKLATGAMASLSSTNDGWEVDYWGNKS